MSDPDIAVEALSVAEAIHVWRLRLATRAGVAFDTWRRQRVSFRLQDAR